MQLALISSQPSVSVHETRVPRFVSSGISTFLLSCDVSTTCCSQQSTSTHGKDDFCLILKKAAFWDAGDGNKGVTLARGVSSHLDSLSDIQLLEMASVTFTERE